MKHKVAAIPLELAALETCKIVQLTEAVVARPVLGIIKVCTMYWLILVPGWRGPVQILNTVPTVYGFLLGSGECIRERILEA